MHRLRLALTCALLWLCSAGLQAQTGPTVLFVATERLTDLALGYEHMRHVARLGLGTPARPWHTWFGGSPELQALVHLPGYQAGTPLRLQSTSLLGNRFAGKSWPDAFASLASFDEDGNGIVEGRELRDLYIWVDFDADGQLAKRDDSLRPASFYYTGFDLRTPSKTRAGHARQGRIKAFSVMVPYASRIHLLELELAANFASRLEAYLSSSERSDQAPQKADKSHPLNGSWRWKLTNPDQWTDATRPWGKEAGGELLLRTRQDRIEGVVQYTGPHEDRINLPLTGSWRDGRAQWTSVSPLGLTRSEVRLESLYGHTVLRARSFSNRNGKVREWTWEAYREQPLD